MSGMESDGPYCSNIERHLIFLSLAIKLTQLMVD